MEMIIVAVIAFLAGWCAYRYVWTKTSWGQAWIEMAANKIAATKNEAEQKINQL